MQGDIRTSQALLGEAARGTRAASGSFTAPTTAQSYMSPYIQAVVDIQQREAQRQADIARTQRAGQAVSAGAFGGSRQAVMEAEAARNLAQQKADIQAMGLQQAYQQGQQQFNVEQQAAAQRAAQMQGIAGTYGQLGLQQAQLGQAGTQLAGQLAGQQAQLGLMPAQLAQTQAGILGQQAGLYGQLGQGIAGLSAQQAGIDLQRAAQLQQAGQGIGSLGMQQASLGQAMQQSGQSDVSALMGVGAMEQANAQAQLDAMRATQMQDVMAPYQQLGFVADIYKGAPSSQSSLIATSQPSASPFQTAAGLGIAGLSAAAGAKKVGLF
jgi:hypothetical protein